MLWFGSLYLTAESAESVIARARAVFGTEAVLNSVETLVYEGRLLSPDGSDEGSIKLYFQKPFRQRIEVVIDETVDITVVNDFEGYIMRRDGKTDSSQRIVLDPQQIKRLHANSSENLNFYRGPLQQRGEIEYGGQVEKLGTTADRIIFEYPNGVRFERFFNSTGELLATLVGNGENGRLELREEGRLNADGIRFPKRVLTYDGDTLIRIVEFDAIKVNHPLEAELFRFPRVTRR